MNSRKKLCMCITYLRAFSVVVFKQNVTRNCVLLQKYATKTNWCGNSRVLMKIATEEITCWSLQPLTLFVECNSVREVYGKNIKFFISIIVLSCHFTFQPQFSSVLCSPLLCHASRPPVRSYSMGGWRCSGVCLVQTVAAKRSHGHHTGEVFTGIFYIKT